MVDIDIQTTAALSGALLVLVLAAVGVQLKGFNNGAETRPLFRIFFLLVSLYLLLYAVHLSQNSRPLHYLLDTVYVACHYLLVMGALRRSGRSAPLWPVLLMSGLYWLVEKMLPATEALRLALGYSMVMVLLAGGLFLRRIAGPNLGDIAMAVTTVAWAALLFFAASDITAGRNDTVNLTLILILTLPTITALAVFLFLSYSLDDHAELSNLASRDALTQAYNRRHLVEHSGVVFSLMRRQESPISLIMLDVDHFKKINDERGHSTGDRALVAVARSLQKDSRLEDLVARIGGEEFAILLPNTTLQEAVAKAERMRESIESIAIEGLEAGSLTASFGVVNGKGSESLSLDDLLTRADRALYRAKTTGRNKIEQEPAKTIT